MIRLEDIEAARGRVASAVYRSPCERSQTLSAMADCALHLKLENLQMTGSFKERGACNMLEVMADCSRSSGVVTASAGNHAQGVAYHARRLGARAQIVMPLGTPLVKVSATQRHGAEVVLHGNNYDEAAAHARVLEQQTGALYVHPFDEPLVMAGQGTLGLELLEQVPDLDVVIVPVGGGGLASGVACAIKEKKPGVLVYGVEAAAAPSMSRALEHGAPISVDARYTIADGIAVRKVGEHTLEACRHYLDGVITVDEEMIASAVLHLIETEKTVAEGAGAVALAAVLSGRWPLAGKRVVALVSGGNIDVNLISRVIDRGLWRSGRMSRLLCEVEDVPGVLSRLLGLVGSRQANVLHIDHQRVGDGLSLGHTRIALVLETRGQQHVDEVMAALADAGIEVRRDAQMPRLGRRGDGGTSMG